MNKKTPIEIQHSRSPKSDEKPADRENTASEIKKPKKPYSKPVVIRYGNLKDLTASGQPGTFMDAQFPGGGTKTGF